MVGPGTWWDGGWTADEKVIAAIEGMDLLMPRSKANKLFRLWGKKENCFCPEWVLLKSAARSHTVFKVFKGVWWNLP